MQISEVESQLGIDRETVRYYISLGLLDTERNKYGHRVYAKEDVTRLKRILLLREMDFSLDEIGEIINGRANLTSEILTSKKEIIEKELARINHAISVCSDLIASDADINFDPEPYFQQRF